MRNMIFSIAATAMLAVPATAQTIDRIKETGKLNLGYRTDAAPLSYQAEGGNPAGYAPEVCVGVGQAITNALKLETLDVSFIPVEANDRFEKVVSGEIDLLCGAATITLSRREIVDFSDPIFVDGTSLLVRVGTTSNFAELAGKKLGVRGSTTTEEALRNSLKAAGMEADVYTFASHDAAMAAMESMEIDAYFADQSILARNFMTSEKAAMFQMSQEILTIEKQGLAMARGDTEFRLMVDRALSQMYASGQMREIFSGVVPGVEPGIALQAMYLVAPTLD